MAERISNPAIQHFDKDTDAPLSGGQMFFFEVNSTTPKDTFSDQAGTVPNTNPVILNAVGLEPDIFGDGSYRIVLQNSVNVQQYERDPVSFEMIGGQFEDWEPSRDYIVNDLVEGTDGNFYSSIQAPNLNNDPTVSPTFWTEFDLLKRWNTNETFDIGDPVTFNSDLFVSLTDANTANQPDISPVNWQGPGAGTISTQIFDVNGGFTWNRPDGVKTVVIELIGGGAGGGASGTVANTGGQGGGAGGYVTQTVDVSAITSFFVTVGNKGAGGVAPSGTGSNATSSAIIALGMTGGGGIGGSRGNGSSTGNFSNGGSASGGDLAVRGNGGDPGSKVDAFSGSGGAAFFGGSGSGRNDDSIGVQAFGPGSGGSGAATSDTTGLAGGDGGIGIVIFTEYR